MVESIMIVEPQSLPHQRVGWRLKDKQCCKGCS